MIERDRKCGRERERKKEKRRERQRETQQTCTCSMPTIETLENGVKYVQSYQ